MRSKKTLFCLFCVLLTVVHTYSQISANNDAVHKEIVISGFSGSGSAQVGFKVKKTDAPYEAVPSAIAVDTKGNVYIADIANERILKYDDKGKFIKRINYRVKDRGAYQIIDDLATDGSDNLYVASREKLKIDKFSSDGELTHSIDLSDKDICWKEKKGWFRCPIQIKRIMLDGAGNIYLQGWNELIKFSSNGNIEKKWAAIRIAFLDEVDNIYLKKESIWEKYDKTGHKIEILKCEEPLFRMSRTGQCIYPQHIDRNGFLYFYEFYESGLTSRGNDRYVKVDRQGKRFGEYSGGGVSGDNSTKFDARGDLYFFRYKKNKFWIERVSWNNHV